MIQPDVPNELFDEDDLPLIQRTSKRKRGRPKKSEVQELSCTYCNKILHTKKGLKVHLRTHTGEKMRQCLFCDAKYARTNHLVRHIALHDKPGIRHPCEHCDKTFEAAADLFKHSREHDVSITKMETDEIKIEIEKFEKDETDIKTEEMDTGEDNQQQNHVEAPTDANEDDLDDFAVVNDFTFSDIDDNSGDEFANKDSKKENVINKAGEKALFECKQCPKVLTTYMGLKVHMRRHTGYDLVNCNVSNDLSKYALF